MANVKLSGGAEEVEEGAPLHDVRLNVVLGQGAKNSLRLFCNHVQEGQGRAVRFAITTLPVTQRAKADAELRRKFGLCKA